MSRHTPEQAKADALAGFSETGPAHINCAQTVVRFALLTLSEDPELIEVARYFGGGISGMGETCGAITGAALALGIRDMGLAEESPELRPRATERLQELIRGFRSKFGACSCEELTGFHLDVPEEHETFMKSEIRGSCAEYVGWMCDALTPLLLDPEGTAGS
jgi:C_GCAxxG_C_C family probable redox protein